MTGVTEITANPSQEKFWNATERYVLFSGGFGSGKTLFLILKTIYDAVSQDDNYILIGRRTYAEIHDSLLKDFLDICPEEWIVSFKRTPQPVAVLRTFSGGTSTIIFRNLDKLSENEIKGLNLGGFAIDQAENIPEAVFNGLRGRLRRRGIEHRGYLTSNPALSWLYKAFVEKKRPNYLLIEASTFENAANLDPQTIEDYKSYPETLYNQYVLGKWDETLFNENAVFPKELIDKAQDKEEGKQYQGAIIYREYNGTHHYQLGIDAAEGAEYDPEDKRDWSVIKIWDHTADEEVLHYSSKVPPSVLAEKAVYFASLYGNPLMIPEMNAAGLALIQKLSELEYSNIYRREEYDTNRRKRMKKLGWFTSVQSKKLLIDRFYDRMRLREPKIHGRETLLQFRRFVYTSVPGKKGAGAQEGFHDDEVMALMLAAFTQDPIKGKVVKSKNDILGIRGVVPTAVIVNGKYRPTKMPNVADEGVAKWTTI